MKKLLFFSLLIATLLGCQQTEKEKEELATALKNIKSTYVPDSRLGVFDIRAEKIEGKWEIEGSTTEAEALVALDEYLSVFSKDVALSVKVLPDTALGEELYGVINNSVINMRVRPGFSSGMAKQGLLGEEIELLEKQGGWYRAKTTDGYISWIQSGAFTRMNADSLAKWKAAPKVIYTKDYGNSISVEKPTKQVSDLVYGNIVALKKETASAYTISYPDGREAIISKKEAVQLDQWLASRNLNKENLLETAKTFMGVPYHWGGNSYKGVDCSGFTRSVYWMNGLELPRDASLQVFEGVEIDTANNYVDLEVGDLLFFGRRKTEEQKEKVVHVGMWIGDGKFIHSQGQVRISSFIEDDKEFDEYNLGRFLKVKRILGNDQKKLSKEVVAQLSAK
ncbi:C40 family peptidase [Sediminitomix flava]|uniref:NlpC/P60 family protein n=1 Tax=Sediminitomix flava TaxID=379075 RepID=A0A315ZDW2_SEDFL|nr:C40 family peptidase [Sediminitomix flava]PWJ43340.1 NlpC/P60 family protein [Sediminitomix flava]